eukprot:3951974-Pleurochrysis_carterae.AAC.2
MPSLPLRRRVRFSCASVIAPIFAPRRLTHTPTNDTACAHTRRARTRPVQLSKQLWVIKMRKAAGAALHAKCTRSTVSIHN